MVMPVKILPLPDFFIYFDIISAYLTKLAFSYGQVRVLLAVFSEIDKFILCQRE
jgi:hypothetical protein